jgi:hypothetical protein
MASSHVWVCPYYNRTHKYQKYTDLVMNYYYKLVQKVTDKN